MSKKIAVIFMGVIIANYPSISAGSFNLVKTIYVGYLGDGTANEVDITDDELLVSVCNKYESSYYSIDPCTGNPIRSFPIPFYFQDHGSEYDSNTGTLFHIVDDDAGTYLYDSLVETDLNGLIISGPFDIFEPNDDSEDPGGLAVDSDTGRMWIAISIIQGGPPDIYEIDRSNGDLIAQLGASLNEPYGLSFNPVTGTLFYADTSPRTLYEIETDGSGEVPVLTIPGDGQLLGMAFAINGDLAVSSDDYGGTIYLFDGDGDGKFINIEPLVPCPNINDGLVGYWSFDEGSGSVAHDRSGNNNDGNIYGGAAWVNGRAGKALDFDGIDDYVDIQNAPELNPQEAITLAAWYKTVSFHGSGNNPIIDKGIGQHTYPYYQYHLGVSGDQIIGNKAAFEFDFATEPSIWNYLFTSTDFWLPGCWYFITGTYDGSTIRLYVNGLLVDIKAASGDIKVYDMPVYIAKFTNFSQYTPGTIDEVRIYNRALTEDEIICLYANPQPQCSNLLDDDGDGLSDYPADLGCTSILDMSELTGDFDDDWDVDLKDLQRMAEFWLHDESSLDIAPLPVGDDIINLLDFCVLAENWLNEAN